MPKNPENISVQSSTRYGLTNLRIEHAASTLRSARALDVDAYERKLRQNAPSPTQVLNHLSEARVALMFLENGAQVTMRDRPDLKIEWLDAMFYAEVKHIKRKEQDKLDEVAMRNARDELVRIADTYRIEKRHPWEQICDVARRKKHQYIASALNILVVDSSSESMEPGDAMARSAAGMYDDALRKTPHDSALRRLHGIMLITSWGSVGRNLQNVAFATTQYALPRMNWNLIQALESICRG
jgi:hypothetical protein